MDGALQDYISKMRQAGKSDDEIKSELLKAGWKKEDIYIQSQQPTPQEENNKLSRFTKYSIYLIILYLVLGVITVIVLSVSDWNLFDGGDDIGEASFLFIFIGWIPFVFLLLIFSILSLVDIRKNHRKGTNKKGKFFSWIIIVLGALAFLYLLYANIFSWVYDANAPVYTVSGLAPLTYKIGVTYEESLKEWEKLKNKNDNSYVFSHNLTDRDDDDILLTKGYEMKVEVKNGVIIDTIYYIWDSVDRRDYREYVSRDQIPSSIDVPIPKTMDQLYDECSEYFNNYSEEKYYKSFDGTKDEIMMNCLLIEKKCLGEGCTRGFYISGFKWLK